MSILTKIKDWWFDFIKPRQKPVGRELSTKAWDKLQEVLQGPPGPSEDLVVMMAKHQAKKHPSINPGPVERFSSTMASTRSLTQKKPRPKSSSSETYNTNSFTNSSIIGAICDGGSSSNSSCGSSSSSNTGSSSVCD